MINTESKFIMFILSSEFYYEFYYEMSIKYKRPYQNSGHSKHHNEIFMIQY